MLDLAAQLELMRKCIKFEMDSQTSGKQKALTYLQNASSMPIRQSKDISLERFTQYYYIGDASDDIAVKYEPLPAELSYGHEKIGIPMAMICGYLQKIPSS